MRGILLRILLLILVFERVDDARFQTLKTDLGTHPVHRPVDAVLTLGGFHDPVVARQHPSVAEYARVLVNLLDARHVHVLAELVRELLLAEEQLVGVGFSRQALAVGVLRIAGTLLGAVNIPEVKVHVVRDNGGDNAVLQVHEGTDSDRANNQEHHGERRKRKVRQIAAVVREQANQVDDGDHDDGHTDEHHGERRPDVQQAAQNQAVVANRVAHLDGGGLDRGVGALHEQAEDTVAIDADLTQLRFEGRTFEEDPVVFEDDALVGGELFGVG